MTTAGKAPPAKKVAAKAPANKAAPAKKATPAKKAPAVKKGAVKAHVSMFDMSERPSPKGEGFLITAQAGESQPDGRLSYTTLKLSSGISGF